MAGINPVTGEWYSWVKMRCVKTGRSSTEQYNTMVPGLFPPKPSRTKASRPERLVPFSPRSFRSIFRVTSSHVLWLRDFSRQNHLVPGHLVQNRFFPRDTSSIFKNYRIRVRLLQNKIFLMTNSTKMNRTEQNRTLFQYYISGHT